MSVLTPGTVFGGRYRIERLLAEGGMGAVYVAQHAITEEKVALKVLWPQVLASAEAVSRFQLEATIAAKVGSEHIVKVTDAGYEDGLKMPFLVMELLRGRTLQEMVEKQGPMSPVETVSMLTQVASALDKAHRYVRDGKPTPIVHRDLKPENIFFTRRESGDPCVKVLDFGIAKVVSDNTKVSRDVKGTPLYMAYEQATGSAITPQTDIWAMGLITFFLLTGRVYWRAANNPDAQVHALFGEILSLPIEPPSQRAAEYGIVLPFGRAFDNWFLQSVNREPSQRFASAVEQIHALSDCLGLGDPNVASVQLGMARTNLAATRMKSLESSGIPSQVAPSPIGQSQVPVSVASPMSGGAVAAISGASGAFNGPMSYQSSGAPQSMQGGQMGPHTAAGMSRSAMGGQPQAGTPAVVYAALALAFVSVIAVVVVMFKGTGGAQTVTPASPSESMVIQKASAEPTPTTTSVPAVAVSASASANTAKIAPTTGGAQKNPQPSKTNTTSTATTSKPPSGGDEFGSR